MSILRRTDVVPTEQPEARPDPAMLRAEAARARADADAEAVRLKAGADQVAAELLAQAEEVEAELAQQVRADAYLAAVTQGRADYDRALRQEADLAALVECNAVHRDEVATRHAAATERATDAQRTLNAAVTRGADVPELEELRLAVATTGPVPDLVAQQLASATEGHRSSTEAHGRATDAVRVAWWHLEQLAATDGLERPSCVPGPADTLAAKLRELERARTLASVAARDPKFQARMAEKRARRDAMRRVLPPSLARITDQSNAAAAFLGTQHRG